jgi:hypothetical protein
VLSPRTQRRRHASRCPLRSQGRRRELAGPHCCGRGTPQGQNGISATPAATNVHLTIYRTVEGEPTVPPPDDGVIDVEPEEISTPEIEAVEDPVVAEWERLKQLDKL